MTKYVLSTGFFRRINKKAVFAIQVKKFKYGRNSASSVGFKVQF